MSDPKNVQFPLKVVLNKQKTKVLYAEVDNEFADVLLSFLTLPLGTIVRVLQKHDPELLVGSITTLYKGIESLDRVHFQTEGCKQMLLNPRTSSEAIRYKMKLKLNVDDSDEPTQYFRCASPSCDFFKYPHLNMYRGILVTCDCKKTTCDCKKSTLSKVIFEDSISQNADNGVAEVFTKRTENFLISDNLKIFPFVKENPIRSVRVVGVKDTDETELMNVTFGFKEIMDLLKGSLLSDTPLTDIILKKRHMESSAVKHDMCISLVPPIVKCAKELVVKAIIQKSTNKLLYIEGDDEFVEFLFSFLIIPLGGIEHILDGSTNLKNIDNLYRTLGYIKGEKYLSTYFIKDMLLNPKQPFGFTVTSNSQFLHLTEETPGPLLFHQDPLLQEDYISFFPDSRMKVCRAFFRSPKGIGNYVKGSTMYIVTDDLVVTPLCTTSCISILNRQKVPLSDVREQELSIGLEEALRILRASLTSTCCLSDGLMNLLLEK